MVWSLSGVIGIMQGWKLVDTNAVSFRSGDDQAALNGIWHLPTRRATNAALIVLHGHSYNKDKEPAVSLCEKAADLGLTALRFDFRYVGATERKPFAPHLQGVQDLIGAFNFLQSFGKEIKPKRLYLIGKSIGGIAALALAIQPQYAEQISGVATLGLLLHDAERKDWYWQKDLENLKAQLLIVQGENDEYGTPAELNEFSKKLPITPRLEIIKGVGHSYEPESNDPSVQDQNMQHVVDLTIGWLEQQEVGREDLRK